MGTALRLNTIVLWRLPRIPHFPGGSWSREGSVPAGRAVSQDTPREADERRPAPSVWERRTRGVELRGPTLVRPPPPFMTPPPAVPCTFEPWPASRGWTGRGGVGRRGRGPAFADNRHPAPPGYTLVGPAPFRGAALFPGRARPLSGGGPIYMVGPPLLGAAPNQRRWWDGGRGADCE